MESMNSPIENNVEAKREKIEAAYLRLPIIDAQRSRVREFIDFMADVNPVYEMYSGFKKLGRNSTKKELAALAKLANELAAKLDNMHAPMIEVLANAGFKNSSVFNPHNQSTDIYDLTQLCRKLANAVELANVSILPLQGDTGRPEKPIANLLGKKLARDFEVLTGKQPTVPFNNEKSKSYGPFLDFVTAIFSAIGIDASAETAARGAIKKHPAKSKEKTQLKKRQ